MEKALYPEVAKGSILFPSSQMTFENLFPALILGLYQSRPAPVAIHFKVPDSKDSKQYKHV